MTLNLVLIIMAFAGLSYLIYRYARYSPWRSTRIGQAFMMMKTALWACLLFILLVRFLPHEPWVEAIRTALIMFVTAAVIVQVSVVVRLQGGWRRRQERRTGNEDLASEPPVTL